MGDYPDEDEEFELMYDDELELINQQEDFDEPIPLNQANRVRKSLDFGTPPATQSSTNEQTNLPREKSFEKKTIGGERVVYDFLSTDSTDDNNLGTTNTRKRTIEELFGEIDDILYENKREPKKLKSDSKYEEDLALIDYIVEMRKQAFQKNDVLSFSRSQRQNVASRDQDNLFYEEPRCNSILVTRSDGRKIYVRCYTEEFQQEMTKMAMKKLSFNGIMGEDFKETLAKARENIQSETFLNNSVDIEESVITSEPSEDENKLLWVDLYKPRKYLELLSDEATNRILLKWIKLWDKVVFNRKPKISISKPNNTKFNKFQRFELNTNLDEDGRPQHTVALLCGPPGLGKTTLAHLVAKHAGYNVIEVNASDERSLTSFKTTLENATQMRSVVDQEKRPNCIVFDEIDGAPSASIEYLIKFITGSGAKSKKDKKQKPTVCKRPIICICNDAYVPALRNLRQMAFVIHFPPTQSTRLAERLVEIARWQQVKTDMGTMIALAEKAHNDVRSCMSALQFYKAQNRPVTLGDVYQSSIGQKDIQKGLFSVWQDIFYIERAKLKFSGAQSKDKSEKIDEYDMSTGARLKKILHTVQSFGDYDRLMQGVYENYPYMNVKHSSLRGVCDAMDWFCYTDIFNKHIHSTQNYTLAGFLPYAFVVWHFVFASLAWPKIKYPSSGYDAKVKQTRNIAIVSELIKGTQPYIRTFVHQKSLILDILPLLSRIIVPNFRPVSLHLYTEEEKKTLNFLVGVMIDYNLTYAQEKDVDGTYQYKLDPDIEQVIYFSKCKSADRRVLSYSNKQLIAKEVETGKMRKLETARNGGEAVAPQKKVGNEKISSNHSSHLPNHLQKLKAKAVKKLEPLVTKDFFGRIVTKKVENENGGPKVTNDIWFRYKEGYSNAVRYKIKISNLM